MDTKLDSLSPEFKPKAIELLARLTEANIPVKIINTLRTDEEQAANLARGASWVKRSKHQDGNAIDICPYLVYRIDGEDKLEWDSKYPIWQKVGVIGESLGLVWGGRWTQVDSGHFELSIKTEDV